MDFTSLESASQIDEFSAWIAEMGKPQVISSLLICISPVLGLQSIFRLVEAQDAKLVDSSGTHQVLLENEP